RVEGLGAGWFLRAAEVIDALSDCQELRHFALLDRRPSELSPVLAVVRKCERLVSLELQDERVALEILQAAGEALDSPSFGRVKVLNFRFTPLRCCQPSQACRT